MSKHQWKWQILRSHGVDVPLKRGWCRVAVSEARQILDNDTFKKVMHKIEWSSLI